MLACLVRAQMYMRVRREQIGTVCLFLCAILLRYSGVFSVGFLSDDFHWLQSIQHTPWWLFLVRNIEGGLGGSSYGPVMNWWYEMLFSVFGTHALWYHIASLVLVFGIAMILYACFREYGFSHAVARVGGLIFLSIPSHTEAIVWVSAQTHLLASFFLLGSWYAAVRYAGTQRGILWFVSVALFCASLLTKEVGILAVPALFTLFLFRSSTRTWVHRIFDALARTVPYIVVASTYFFARAYATGGSGYHAQSVRFGLEQMLHASGMVVSYTVGLYASVPWRYAAHVFGVTHPVFVCAGVLFLLGAVLALSRHRARTFAHVVFLFMCLVPFLFLGMSPVHSGGERYTFLFSIALTLLVASFGPPARVFSLRVRSAILMVLLLGSLVGLLHGRALVRPWQVSSFVVQRLLYEFAWTIPSSTPVVLFGLPDTVLGVEALRNGMAPAMQVLYNKAVTLERVPQYTVVYGNASSPCVRARYAQLVELRADMQECRFTGFPQWIGEYTSSTITDFTRVGFLGSGVDIARITSTPFALLVWDGKTFLRVE
jgi:protein O-mannosyl-transferase